MSFNERCNNICDNINFLKKRSVFNIQFMKLFGYINLQFFNFVIDILPNCFNILYKYHMVFLCNHSQIHELIIKR